VMPVATTVAEPVALATTTKARQRTTKSTPRPAAGTTTVRSAKRTGAAQPKTVTTRPHTGTIPPKAATTRARKNVKPAAPAPSCTASVDNRTPGAGESVVVTVASTLPGTPFTVTAHYKSKAKPLSGVTDGAGAGAVTFDIGAATKGYTVKLDVNVSGQATCSTEFTPQ
jgi:hypothetical protein